MLDGIPLENQEQSQTSNAAAGSLWNFWNVLDSILPSSSDRRQKRSLTQPDQPSRCSERKAQLNSSSSASSDYIFLALSFVDFWLTAMSDQECSLLHLCTLASETVQIGRHDPLFVNMEDILTRGAALYLQSMTQFDYERLMQAVDYGKNGISCDIFMGKTCAE